MLLQFLLASRERRDGLGGMGCLVGHGGMRKFVVELLDLGFDADQIRSSDSETTTVNVKRVQRHSRLWQRIEIPSHLCEILRNSVLSTPASFQIFRFLPQSFEVVQQTGGEDASGILERFLRFEE